jgi:ribosomal protein L11 methyltransferase
MPWLELHIHSTRDQAEDFEDRLLATGAHSVTLEDNADQPLFEPALGETPLWAQTRVIGLYDADSDTRAIESQLPLDTAVRWHWKTLEDKDWEREWMANYHPIQCAPNLWICPSWLTPPDPQAVNLMLDPGLAFGTGTHPTTFLCLAWLAAQSLRGKRIMDYGCGSGILGIGALLLGADEAIGVDLDPQAIIASRENTVRNGLAAERFRLAYPNQCPADIVDVVVANILAGPLVELKSCLLNHLAPAGLLCLSGILREQAATVMAAYADSIAFDPIQRRDEWVCLTGRRH